MEFFWSVFSCFWTQTGDLQRKSLYLVWIQENTDQKKTLYLENSHAVIILSSNWRQSSLIYWLDTVSEDGHWSLGTEILDLIADQITFC